MAKSHRVLNTDTRGLQFAFWAGLAISFLVGWIRVLT
jgi:hypothetical protein